MPIYKLDGKKAGLQRYKAVVSYTDDNGEYKQKAKIVYGMQEAKKAEAELLEAIHTAPASRMTVADLIKEYNISHRQETRETTHDKAMRELRLYVEPYVSSVLLDKLTAAKMQEWKNQVGELDISIRTKKNAYKTFSALLNYGVKVGRLQKNNLKTVGNFRDATETPEAEKLHYYTADEYARYMAAAARFAESHNDWRYYTFFAIAFYTGARKGEINALKWSDIDGTTMHIRRSIAQKLKGEDRETPPKNKSSYRDIQIPQPLQTLLKEQQARQQQNPAYTDDWRICGGDAILRDTTIDKHNQAYAIAAGLPHIRIHDFRHTHASLLVNEGINIQEISRRLGHANVEITWKTYAHLYPKEEQRVLKILDALPLSSQPDYSIPEPKVKNR